MQIDAIIQARMGSKRYYGKVLREIAGKSLLLMVVERARKIKGIGRAIVATTNRARDKKIIRFCEDNGILWFAGDEDDVLGRYVEASKKFRSDIVIRLTADNPLVEPKIIQLLVKAHLENRNDYTFSAGFPLGSSGEIFNASSLEEASQVAEKPIWREHLGVFFLEGKHNFKVGFVKAPKGLREPKIRLTVDVPKDLVTIRNIIKHFNNRDRIGLEEIIDVWHREPEIFPNRDVKQLYPAVISKKVILDQWGKI